ncbi:hypothetical protein Leryth_003417, partial [Lithospermum erythrorhizon]
MKFVIENHPELLDPYKGMRLDLDARPLKYIPPTEEVLNLWDDRRTISNTGETKCAMTPAQLYVELGINPSA